MTELLPTRSVYSVGAPAVIEVRDLAAPGLREQWDAGDLSSFHGWNKQLVRTAERPDAY